MCFVLPWKIGFTVIYKALKLSQCSIGGRGRAIPRSRSKKDSHVSLAAVDAMEQYSASALDRDTIDCFLTFQEMQLLPRNVQNPVVDCQLIKQPT